MMSLVHTRMANIKETISRLDSEVKVLNTPTEEAEKECGGATERYGIHRG